VARDLLGKYLVVKNGNSVLSGKIVETEAYRGEDDLACHASKGRTPRTETLYAEAGTIYVYLIYGMYHCLNIVFKTIFMQPFCIITFVHKTKVWSRRQSVNKIFYIFNIRSVLCPNS